MAYELIQWEYRFNRPHEEELNKLGEQGWEVAAVSGGTILLKRPKQPQQQPSRPSFVDRYYGR